MSANTWREGQPLPFGIADAPAVSFDGKILIFGGYGKSPKDVKNHVLEYNPVKDAWCSRSPMSKARWGAAAALHGDHVYVFGGRQVSRLWGWYSMQIHKAVERYDVAKDAWTTLRSLPRSLRTQGLMAAKVGSRIYLFSNTFTFEYHPVTDSYASRSSAPLARLWATCAHVRVSNEDRIYIIGGQDHATSDATDVNYYYLPASDAWVGPCAPAPYRAYGATSDNPVWKNRIYFGFGHKNPDLFYKDVYAYDPETDKWSPLSKARFERDGVSSAIIDGTLYVIGGRSEPNNAAAFGLNYNEQLKL